MDPQQRHQNQGHSGQEPDDMLPPVTGAPPQGMSADDIHVPVVPANQTMPVETALVPTPHEAADIDLIEKEWVVKAKHIVDQTSEDPFAQAEELKKIKADYLKKRYNRDVGAK